ncbi:hypothetical protein [Haloferula rosea]|uniref:Uncharacterized protein n=1 Tax=Haloferula rosea TaxID=490093 RepID=A0A934RIT1_9BACT|nr:hypothetical protein [Haloferula rosea]MBK1829050.1 hypothetical protein [Haloferula rosea]
MRSLRKILRCDTIEDCRRIQRGFLPLRRLGKWSVLFTIALMLLINEAIGLLIDGTVSQYDRARSVYEDSRGAYEQQRQDYENLRQRYQEATSSILYRWTFGLFNKPVEVRPAPGSPPQAPAELDRRALTVYHTINWIQLIFFVGFCAYCLRWVYADFRADDKQHRFRRFCVIAGVTNLILYFSIRSFVWSLLGGIEEKPNKAALLTPAPPRVQFSMAIQPSTHSRSCAQGQV